MKQRLRVAVVGGGIFGVTAAIEIARGGHKVDLFERQPELLRGASSINQGRLHRGYHYPRSLDTAISCKVSEQTFRSMYGLAVVDRFDHYYAVAARDSLTSADDFTRFCERLALEYEEACPQVLRRDNLATCVRVRESVIDFPRPETALHRVAGVGRCGGAPQHRGDHVDPGAIRFRGGCHLRQAQ